MNVLAIDQGTSATKAVGLGNQGETVLAWDRPSGRPIGPAISWQDRRGSAIVREFAPHGERLAELPLIGCEQADEQLGRYEAAARALIDLRQPTR